MLITPWSHSFGCVALNNTLNASAPALSLVAIVWCVHFALYECETRELLRAASHALTDFCLAVSVRNCPGEENLQQVNFAVDRYKTKLQHEGQLFSCIFDGGEGVLQF